MVLVGPTGTVVKGHVLDVNYKAFDRALKLYDPQLYLKWNPKKCRKYGCWEIRRKPDEKTLKPADVYQFEGYTISWPKYHEMSMVNHVLDAAFLNYSILGKLKAMDMWTHKETGYKGKDLTKTLDYKEAKYLDKIEDQSLAELKYNLKQIRSELGGYKDFIAHGGNPALLADYWGK